MTKKSEIAKIKRLLKELREERKYRIMWVLSNQVCLIGDSDIQIMRWYLQRYRGKEVTDVFRINRNHNQLNNGVTTLDKIIDISNELPQ